MQESTCTHPQYSSAEGFRKSLNTPAQVTGQVDDVGVGEKASAGLMFLQVTFELREVREDKLSCGLMFASCPASRSREREHEAFEELAASN